ncbi:MAG: hypothetical protein Q7S87_17945 [Agitococcus sp.]|nr:hypothetical protein [Agitococcus sp.]
MNYSHTRFTALGQYFGFPPCCVAEFLATNCQSTKVAYPRGIWWGTGYVPCLCCAKTIEAQGFDQFIQDVIEPARECALLFPDDTVCPKHEQQKEVDFIIACAVSKKPRLQQIQYAIQKIFYDFQVAFF